MTKLLLKIAQIIRRLYWRLVKPTTRGVRAIVVGQSGKVLLVLHRYEEGWFLPGGKVGRGESDDSALRRELREELGISELTQVTILGGYMNTHEYKKDTIVVYVVRSFAQQPKRHFEIKAQGFFHPQDLPPETSPGTRRRIEEWLGKRNINNQW